MLFKNDVLNNYIVNNSSYVLFRVCKDGENLDNPYIRSATCEDFTSYSLNFFKKIGVPIEFMSYPKFIEGSLVATDVKKLDYNKDREQILTFYRGILKFMDDLATSSSDIFKFSGLVTALTMNYMYNNYRDIIYYTYDVDNKSQMAYYSMKLVSPAVYKYRKTLIENSVQYVPFKQIIKNNLGNSNQTINNYVEKYENVSNSSKVIIYVSIALIVIIFIILMYVYRKKLKTLLL
jgi:hypothetical protein